MAQVPLTDLACMSAQVRSNEKGNAGKLLADWRRINVALTRPKRKLVVIGSRRTTSTVPILASLWGFGEARGWLVQLPARWEGAH